MRVDGWVDVREGGREGGREEEGTCTNMSS